MLRTALPQCQQRIIHHQMSTVLRDRALGYRKGEGGHLRRGTEVVASVSTVEQSPRPPRRVELASEWERKPH